MSSSGSEHMRSIAAEYLEETWKFAVSSHWQH